MTYQPTGTIYAQGAAHYATIIALDLNLNDQVSENMEHSNGILEYCERAAIAIHVLASKRETGSNGWYPVDLCEAVAEHLNQLFDDDKISEPEFVVDLLDCNKG